MADPKLPIKRVILESDGDCDGCGVPLFCGEPAYLAGNVVGCSPLCCHDAACDRDDRDEVETFLAGFGSLIGGAV
jgi:hypothetical protein